MNAETMSIQWGMLAMWLVGGLALFLFGMEKMSTGLRKVAGDRMRSILSLLTRNRIIALIIGAFVTTVVQSSSATTVMLVSFVQAQLMSFANSIGVILGANIGSTVTAQLIAFNLSDYALLMIAIGFGVATFAKDEKQKYIGESILGFGILFFGMKLMSDAMRPLRSYEPFIDLLRSFENPLLGMLVGAVFTALIQSSGALTGIVIVLAQQGVLTLEAGIPLILGANIGTCVTAGLASIGASREAKRVALAHVTFNIIGAMIFLFLIPVLSDVVRAISPHSDLTGVAKLSAETPRQIANAHTLFNVVMALAFLPLTNVLARVIIRVFPQKEIEQGIAPTTKYISEVALATPALALDLARNEVARMANLVVKMLTAVMRPFFEENPERDSRKPELTLMEGIEMRDGKLDFLEKRVSEFLLRLSRGELSVNQANETYLLISVVDHLESTGDVVMRNIVPLIAKKEVLDLDFSEKGKEELQLYFQKIRNQLKHLHTVLKVLDHDEARQIMLRQEKYSELEIQLRSSHLERLRNRRRESLETHEVHLELLDMLKMVNVYAGEVAKFIYDFAHEREED